MSRQARGPLAGALALAACLAVLAVLSSGSDEGDKTAAGPGRSFLGLVAEDAFGKPGAYRERNLDRLRSTGAGIVRQTFDWARIERAPGRYDLAFYDRYVAALASRHLRLLPILFNPPPFRSSAPADPRRGTYPPRRPADMGEFGALLARRYGPGGSFWREHPGLPRLPVRSWQVWNEPNLPVYWPSGPDAAEYVALLRATGRGIRRVDPGAEIVTAGLPDSRLGVPLRDYVAAMYAAGGAGAFDALAVNPYGLDAAWRARHREGRADSRRRERRQPGRVGHRARLGHRWAAQRLQGERAAPGRAAGGHRARTGAAAGRGCASAASSTSIGAIPLPTRAGADFFGLHTGLLRLDGHAKPAFSSYKKVAKRLGLLPD